MKKIKFALLLVLFLFSILTLSPTETNGTSGVQVCYPPPGQGSCLTPTTVSSSEIRINWTGSILYSIWRSTSSGGPFYNVHQVATADNNSWTDTGLTANTTYYYRLRISGGTYSPIADATTFNPDTTRPNTSDNYGAKNDVWQKLNQTITLTPSDPTPSSGIAWTKYCTSSATCDPATGTTYSSAVTISTEGTTYFRYASRDNAGNTQTTVQKIVKIDKQGPTTSDNYGAKDNVWQKLNQTITLTPSDPAPSSVIVWTKYCTSSSTCDPATTGTTLNSPFQVTITTEGTTYFHYASRDNAGNTQTTVQKIVKIDKLAPGGGTISYASGDYISASVPITYSTGSDPIPGSDLNNGSGKIQRASLAIVSGACPASGYIFSNLVTEFDGSYTDTSIVRGNCYKYQYIISDNAGNQSNPYTSNSIVKYALLPTVPGKPVLTATAFSASQINLSWTIPSDGGSSITGYIIERCLDGDACATGGTWTSLATTGANVTTYNDIGPQTPKDLADVNGATSSWVCRGLGGAANSNICTATRIWDLINGECGAATTPPATYAYDGNSTTISTNLCTTGTPPSAQTLEAPEGSSVSWTCAGLNGGIQSPSCRAIRGFAPYCGDGIKNGGEACDTGDFPGDVDSGGCSGGKYCATGCICVAPLTCGSTCVTNTDCQLATGCSYCNNNICSVADEPGVNNMTLGTNYCGADPAVTFGLVYTDTNTPSSNEKRYIIEVSNEDPDFAEGNIDFTYDSADEYPNLNHPSGSANNAIAYITKNFAKTNELKYDTTYYWRVKVYSQQKDSGWVYYNGTPTGTKVKEQATVFTTPVHFYPSPEFTVDPASKIIVNNHAVITFTDESTCFDNDQKPYSCKSKNPKGRDNGYTWVFGDTTDQDNTRDDTTHDYRRTWKFYPTLTVCDNSLTPTGCCTAEGEVEIINPGDVPEWKEVSPF